MGKAEDCQMLSKKTEDCQILSKNRGMERQRTVKCYLTITEDCQIL